MYEVRVTKLNEPNGKTHGFASVDFDEGLRVNNIAIREAKNGDLFVAMPQRQHKLEDGKFEYSDICYCKDTEFRDSLYANILDVFASGEKEKVFETDLKGLPNIKLDHFTDYEKGATVGLATVSMDDVFVIKNISVCKFAGAEGKNDFYKVNMPAFPSKNEKGETVYKDICYPHGELAKTFYKPLVEKAKEIQASKAQKEEKTVDAPKPTESRRKAARR